MNSSSLHNLHSFRTFIKYFLAIIALLLAIAPAGAQTEPLSPPSDVRFSADGRTVSWDPPTGLVGHYRIHYGWTKGEIGELHDIPLGNVTSFRIPDFDPSATWQARVRAMHADDHRLHSWYGPWEYWHPPTPTPSPTPTTRPPLLLTSVAIMRTARCMKSRAARIAGSFAAAAATVWMPTPVSAGARHADLGWWAWRPSPVAQHRKARRQPPPRWRHQAP